MQSKPSPSIKLAHTKALQHGMASYPLQRNAAKSFIIPRGNHSVSKENLFLGQFPTRIIAACVDNSSYNGTLIKPPFNFKNYNINLICFCRDGVQIADKPLQSDFENDLFICCYTRLFSQTGQSYRETGKRTSREDNKNVCGLFAFVLAP